MRTIQHRVNKVLPYGGGWGVNKPAQLLTTAAAVYVVTVSVDIVAAAHTEDKERRLSS